jgi:hypothetical protein
MIGNPCVKQQNEKPAKTHRTSSEKFIALPALHFNS